MGAPRHNDGGLSRLPSSSARTNAASGRRVAARRISATAALTAPVVAVLIIVGLPVATAAKFVSAVVVASLSAVTAVYASRAARDNRMAAAVNLQKAELDVGKSELDFETAGLSLEKARVDLEAARLAHRLEVAAEGSRPVDGVGTTADGHAL
jgi:hypothetical protein